jgi:hypothetical protein
MQLLDRESYAVAHDLEHYEVSRDVNSVRNNGPHLLDPFPVPVPVDGSLSEENRSS